MTFDSLVTGILKIIAVVALISLATLTILLEVVAFRQQHRNVTWHWHAGMTLLTAFCFYSAYMLVRRPSNPTDDVYCQRCHALGGHADISPYPQCGEWNGVAFLGLFVLDPLFGQPETEIPMSILWRKI